MATTDGIVIRKHPKRPPLPQDTGWSWMIVLGVFCYVFFMVGIAKSYGLFLLAFIKHFGVSVAVASMPLSMSGIVYAFGAPAALIVAEKFSARWVVVFGAFVGFIGMAISSALVSMGFVTFFFGVMVGVGNSCFYGNGLVMIGKYFRKRRSLATGLGLAGASIGQFALPPLIEFLLETYGLGGTVLIMAALYLHAAVSGALFRPLSQYGPPLEAEEVRLVTREEGQTGETKVFVKIRDDLGESEGDIAGYGKAYPDTASSEVNGTGPQVNGGAYYTANGSQVSETFHSPTKEYPASDRRDGEGVDGTLSTRKEKPKEVQFDPPPSYEDTTRRIEDGDEDDDDDDGEIEEDDSSQAFAERKAMLASTGSIFLVSPSVMDITDVDDKARAISPHSSPHALRRRDRRKAICATITGIFDFRVLRSYITIFYTISCFLCFYGYFCHIMFLPPILVEKGITKYDKALLISICGVGELLSRVSTGFFADLNFVPRYRISATGCSLCAINILLTLPASSFGWLSVHCFFYGFFGGAYVSLLSVVLVDMVGLAMMSKNLAVILLIQGVGSAIGQMFMGWLKDISGNYNIVIILCSVSMLTGGLMLFLYPLVRKREAARLARVGRAV